MWSNRQGLSGMLPQVIFIIIFAAVIAAALFLAVPLLQGRPEYPAGTFPWTVGGTTVLVEMDPNQEVYLVPLGSGNTGGTGGTGNQVIPLPTMGPTPTPTPIPLPTLGPTPTPPAASNCATAILFVDYVVQAGDTLYSISNRYVTSIPLMARFGISSVNIVPGNTIRVPVGDPACCPAGFKPYVVQEGDTMFGIAQACGTTISNLQAANGMGSSTSIYMTQILCIPQ